MAEVFNSKHTSAEIEDILDSAGLVSTAEDETYSVKIVDSAGTLLLGIKLTGELDVPIGITDDAYNLIKAMYDKLGELTTYMKENQSSAGESELIQSAEDDTYVLKAISENKELLFGFKENGEIVVPIGITDDCFTVIQVIYEKLVEAIPAIKNYCDANFVSKDIVNASEDDSYVMKLIDANNNLLLGFKENGELDSPIGITDGAYNVLTAIFDKLTEITANMNMLTEKVNKLS